MSLDLNPDAVPIFTHAAVYMGKTLTPTRPADIDTDFGLTWDNLGVLKGDDGIKNAREWDRTEHFGWGIGLYRVGYKNYKESRVVTILESNPTTRRIAFPGSTATNIFVPRPNRFALAYEFLNDAGRKERWFTAVPANCWIPNLDRNESDPAGMEMTADIFARGDGLLYVRQYTPVHETQVATITGTPTGGTFKLIYGETPTANIVYNAAASAVKAALEAILGAGNVEVTGSAGGPYTITLQGALAGEENQLLTADAALLTGGTAPAVVITEP